MGDFAIRSVPSDHSRVERCCLLSLFFPQKIFRHNYNERVLRFRVQSSLGCDGEKTGSLAPFSNDSQASLDPWSWIRRWGLFWVIPSPRRIAVLWLWVASVRRSQVFDNRGNWTHRSVSMTIAQRFRRNK